MWDTLIKFLLLFGNQNVVKLYSRVYFVWLNLFYMVRDFRYFSYYLDSKFFYMFWGINIFNGSAGSPCVLPLFFFSPLVSYGCMAILFPLVYSTKLLLFGSNWFLPKSGLLQIFCNGRCIFSLFWQLQVQKLSKLFLLEEQTGETQVLDGFKYLRLQIVCRKLSSLLMISVLKIYTFI